MLYVIGLGIEGRKGLGKSSLDLISRAGLLVGGARHLDEFANSPATKLTIRGDLKKTVRQIRAYMKRDKRSVVVLATGDPLLFGIGGLMVAEFAGARGRGVRIIPNVSIVQEACARIRTNWHDLRVISVHGRSGGLASAVAEIIASKKTAIFTDRINTPARIARALAAAGAEGISIYVLEALGTKDERITSGSPRRIARRTFNPLNIMVTVKNDKERSVETHPLVGIPDERFASRAGMITKQETRAVVLAKLALRADSVVWDIGSGSGSVAVEAARLAHSGSVIAVEKQRARAGDIEVNKARFNASNLKVIIGIAPQCLKGKGFSRPDSVFIGGGGGALLEILRYVSTRVKNHGRVVVNAVTVETLTVASGFFKRRGWSSETLALNIAKTGAAGLVNIFRANNPVHIITGIRP